MFWGFSKALTFSLSLTHTLTLFPFLPSVLDCSDWCHVLKASAWSSLYLYKHPFIESALFSVCSARFSSLRCRCVLRAFASCLEELRLLTPALVPYGPLYKVRNCQQTNWQQSPPTAAGERESLKKRKKMYTCEPGDIMRGGLRWKMSWRERRLASCWRCVILQPSGRVCEKCCRLFRRFLSRVAVGWSKRGVSRVVRL